MTCNSCVRGLPSDARFCPACGTAVAERAGADSQTDAELPSPEPTPTSRTRVVTVLGNVLAVLAGGAVGVLAGLLIVRGW